MQGKHCGLRSLEVEAGVVAQPLEYANRASFTITAAEARAALHEMGIHVPMVINDKSMLQQALEMTQRMTPVQKTEFLMRISGAKK